MKLDYQYERNLKVYLQVHGDEGLSKHIILSVLPQINTDLAEVLAGITDFDLQIDFNEKGIRFMFERDGKRFNLYQGSGFEKAISCLALHYVNIRMTTLPISNNLVLDEIFGGVSKKNIESIDKILRKLTEVFDTVDIITHTLTDEFRKIVDNAFLIQKENNSSKIIY
jgi:DNA repair exonuclease SbcCD ATPase subunit